MTAPIPISRLRPKSRCPQCGTRRLRNAPEEQEERSVNGVALFTLSQRCMMCEWSETHENVKMGA